MCFTQLVTDCRLTAANTVRLQPFKQTAVAVFYHCKCKTRFLPGVSWNENLHGSGGNAAFRDPVYYQNSQVFV